MEMSSALVERLLWLCSIASPTGSEATICDSIHEFLRSACAVDLEIRRVSNSLVVRLNRASLGPKICLFGHTDVVPTQHDGPPRVDGDRLYGAGAADMKSGLSLMLGLVTNPCDTACALTLIFYAGEEGPYSENELGRVVDDLPELDALDFALALEPTDNQLQLGCGGSIQAHVQYDGKSAHSARPWQGENAIYKAVDLLKKLSMNQPQPRVIEDLTWMKSISATLIQGGRAPNVIPDSVTLNLNARYAPDQSRQEIEDEIRELIGPDADLRLVDVSPSAPPHRGHPLLNVLRSCGVEQIQPKFAWTDVARFALLGVPAANFGPGTLSQAHQRNEWTSISALLNGDQIVRRWLGRLT